MIVEPIPLEEMTNSVSPECEIQPLDEDVQIEEAIGGEENEQREKIEEASFEQRKPKVMQSPTEPTKKEREENKVF